jgi:hypothetical protein
MHISMIVMRLALLLDRDPVTVSFQSVYRCLHHPEVVEELIRLMREDPFQSERIEEDIRHYTDEFIRTYQTIDWELHGRLLHLRNLGLAHLGYGTLTKSITHEELRRLVQLVKDPAACLSRFTPNVPQIHQDQTEDRITRGTAMWLAAFRCAE